MGEDEIFKKENVVFYSACTIFPIFPPHCDILRRTTYCKRPLLLSFVELVNLFFKKSSKTVIDTLFGNKNGFTNIFWTIHVRLLRSIKIILIWFNRICLVWKRQCNLFSHPTLKKPSWLPHTNRPTEFPVRILLLYNALAIKGEVFQFLMFHF